MGVEQRGRFLLSIEALPIAIANAMPAGFGRSEPNSNPTLPPPTGRLHFVRELGEGFASSLLSAMMLVQCGSGTTVAEPARCFCAATFGYLLLPCVGYDGGIQL